MLYILPICKHFCLKQGCNFTYLFCLIVELMFLNMHPGTVAYKVVVFRINKTDFLMQLILVYFITFFSIPSAKSYELICPALKCSLKAMNGSYVRQNVNGSLLNAIRTVCSFAVRQPFVSSTAVFIQQNCSLLILSWSTENILHEDLQSWKTQF